MEAVVVILSVDRVKSNNLLCRVQTDPFSIVVSSTWRDCSVWTPPRCYDAETEEKKDARLLQLGACAAGLSYSEVVTGIYFSVVPEIFLFGSDT